MRQADKTSASRPCEALYNFAASSYTASAVHIWLPDLTFDVVGCGYEQDIFFKKTDTPYKHGRIIFNGNLKRRKGFRVLQNAIDTLSERERRACEIIFVGTTSVAQKKTIEDWAVTSGTKVLFFSNIPKQQLATLYNSSMVNVLPSLNSDGHFEGFGIVHSESIACGTFTIGSLNCGNVDAISVGNGICIEQNDADALATELRKLLQKNSKLMLDGRAPFTWQQIGSHIEKKLTHGH